MVPIEMNWNFSIRDASDTAIIKTAVSGKADYICTLDRDFDTPEVEAFCGSVGIVVLDDLAMLQRFDFLSFPPSRRFALLHSFPFNRFRRLPRFSRRLC
jgi:hypothetical protein